MSRVAVPPSGRPIFASKTTFDALAVESGEESEEEEQPSGSDGDAGQRFVIPLCLRIIL